MNKIFLIALSAMLAFTNDGHSITMLSQTLTCGSAKLTCTGTIYTDKTFSEGEYAVCNCPTDSTKDTKYRCVTPNYNQSNITTDVNINNSGTPISTLWTVVSGYSCYVCEPDATQSCTSYNRVGTQTCSSSKTWGSCTSFTRCSSGYYYTSTSSLSSTSGCKSCPANATCSGSGTYSISCSAGYYRASSTATSCTICPDSDDTGVATSAAGSVGVTNCYLPDGTTGSDETGSYVIDGGKCNYS